MNQPVFSFFFYSHKAVMAYMSAHNPPQHEDFSPSHIRGGIRNITCKSKKGLKRMKQVKDFSFTRKWKVLRISLTVRGTDQSRLRLSIFLTSL